MKTSSFNKNTNAFTTSYLCIDKKLTLYPETEYTIFTIYKAFTTVRMYDTRHPPLP